jgi:hypothetical protein
MLASFDAQGDLVVSAGNDLVTLSQAGTVISAVSNSSSTPNGTLLSSAPCSYPTRGATPAVASAKRRNPARPR